MSSPDLVPSAGAPFTWLDSQMSAELLAQAITVAAPRLLVHNLSIARLKLLFDIHVTNAGPTVPIALDTHRLVVISLSCCAAVLLCCLIRYLHCLLNQQP